MPDRLRRPAVVRDGSCEIADITSSFLRETIEQGRPSRIRSRYRARLRTSCGCQPLTGRRGASLRLAIAALRGEGAAVAVNHGDCPLGPLHERLGDPVPLFELGRPPRAAKLAVPALGALAAMPMLLIAARSPELSARRARRNHR